MEGQSKQPEMDLSLVVPCYNEAPHLKDSTTALLEVLDQTRYQYEIVFVDDCSKDNTRAVIQEICQRSKRCRYIFHETNRGRGGAFKTGFQATTGRVTGFIDIDLEVGAHYVPALVNQIDRHGYDIVTGYRHYLLSQTGPNGLVRHILSHGYRTLTRTVLGLGVYDSETGCKFFKRATTTGVVLGCEYDGWFWDTEVMSRAVLENLSICEMPVLFRRRMDKQSTVRMVPDSWRYLKELHQFRNRVGLGLTGKSPVYWSARGYDAMMTLLYGGYYREVQGAVAKLIPDGASVVDVCCGTGRLYRDFLQAKRCGYLGLEFNGHFVMAARRRGTNIRYFNLLTEPVPEGEYVVMCSSFYHFQRRQAEVLAKMRAAARKAVIITEPVHNLSAAKAKPLARLANRLTNPGVGDYDYRFDLESFRAFAQQHGATEFHHEPGQRNAIAIFRK